MIWHLDLVPELVTSSDLIDLDFFLIFYIMIIETFLDEEGIQIR